MDLILFFYKRLNHINFQALGWDRDAIIVEQKSQSDKESDRKDHKNANTFEEVFIVHLNDSILIKDPVCPSEIKHYSHSPYGHEFSN